MMCYYIISYHIIYRTSADSPPYTSWSGLARGECLRDEHNVDRTDRISARTPESERNIQTPRAGTVTSQLSGGTRSCRCTLVQQS